MEMYTDIIMATAQNGKGERREMGTDAGVTPVVCVENRRDPARRICLSYTVHVENPWKKCGADRSLRDAIDSEF